MILHKSEFLEFEIEYVKYQKKQVLLKLKGINSIEDAEKYKQDYLKIHRKDAKSLPEDTYFIADLIGLDVFTNSNEFLGKVEDIFPTGSNDVYVVKDDLGKQILLPAIKDVINSIDIENKRIIVTLIDGLI